MEKESKLLKLQNLFIYYFSCSVVGWILEMLYGYAVYGHFVDRGFLYGPMCPIYGCGIVLIVLITEALKKKKVDNIYIEFLVITLVFTALEYTVSLVLELIFGLRWWDYTNEFLNINGRVCLMFSMLFGIMGVAFIRLAYQPTKTAINKMREKISANKIWVFLIILSIIWITDTVISIFKYI